MSYTTYQRDYINKRAAELGIQVEKILAFLAVETNGQVYATVYGKQEPLIRWEGHYFKKFLKGDKLARAIAQKLAGAYKEIKNPSTQAARYDMLERGKKIDYDAAVMSCSWGIGQVMGSHWQKLGYASTHEFETKVRGGFEGQFDAVVAYLSAFGVIPHLKRGDWSAVARLYNGSDYAVNKYDTKMKAEYERLIKKTNVVPTSSGMVRAGSKGPQVREVQNLLKLLGYNLNVDGDFGKSTQDAVKEFQIANGLEADGVVGPRTYEKLSASSTLSQAELTAQPVQSIPEVQKGVIAAVSGGLSIEAVKGTIQEALSHVTSVPGLEKVSALLSLATAAVVIAGLAYSGYGFLKSKRSRLGTQ